MSKAQYDIYKRKVLDLARRLVVKSGPVADAINTELRALGLQINENDPTSWKYYLHLAGEYHSTDTVMTVKSLDTLETIVFNKANLNIHLATSREYREFGSYYRALVAQYPDQEDLIRGIINPVDINTAIAAEDGQILYYDADLVEENEENLIAKLEVWCKVFSRRWMVRAYAFVDDLYVAAHRGLMYQLIPAVIMNIRLGNCHTNYAHSYHIREYLASHQKLDEAVDYMTKKQMLWLYREIRYIERNAGKQSTFNSLLKHIMTDRGLPLSQWDMRHNLAAMPDAITPNVEFVRSALNLNLTSGGAETRNVTEMLEAEADLTLGNTRVMDDVAPIIREQMEYSLNDKLETKVLESSVLDMTDAAIFTKADTLLNHWLFLAFKDRYTAVITVDNPRTGAPLVLSAKEAFIVYVYVFGKALGLNITHLPVLPANNVRRLNIPARSVLQGMIAKEHQDPEVLDAIYAAIEPTGTYISTEAFNRAAVKIHEGLMQHRWIWATRENRDERGQVEAAAMHLYFDYPCDLGNSQTYTAWFAERGLDMPQFTELEAGLLADSLVSYATGANLTASISLRDIQAAMLRIMATLSSYSIQFLQSINTQPILVNDWPEPRIGKIHATAADTIGVNNINLYVQDVRERGRGKDHLPDIGWGGELDDAAHGRIYDRIDFDLISSPSGETTFRYRIELPRPNNVEWNVTAPELEDLEDLDTDSYKPINSTALAQAFATLESDHYALDAEDLQTLTERWNNRPVEAPYVLYGDGLYAPNPFEANTYVPLFEMPIYVMDAFLTELEYPTWSFHCVLDDLEYPKLVATAVLDDLVYPTAPVEMTLNRLRYSDVEREAFLNDLQYPSLTTTVMLDELNYPEIGQVVLDDLEYPVVEQTLTLNRLNYTPVIMLDDLDYPDVDYALESDGLPYPS